MRHQQSPDLLKHTQSAKQKFQSPKVTSEKPRGMAGERLEIPARYFEQSRAE